MGSDTIVHTDCIKHVDVYIHEQLNDKVKVQYCCCKVKAALFKLLSTKIESVDVSVESVYTTTTIWSRTMVKFIQQRLYDSRKVCSSCSKQRKYMVFMSELELI